MRSVFFIDGNKFIYFGGSNDSLIELLIPSSALQDMEIIKNQELENLLSEFFNINKISTSEVIICLTPSSYFQKDVLPHDQLEDIQKIQDEFIDTVPFESVSAKYYNQATSAKIIAVNSSFIKTLIEILKKHGFTILSVVPVFALFPNPITSITNAVGEEFIKNFKSLSEVGLPINEQEKSFLETPRINKKNNEADDFKPVVKKSSKKRLYGLISLFFLLTIILAVVYSSSKTQKAANKNIAIIPVEATTKTQDTLKQEEIVSPTPEEFIELNKDMLVIEITLSQDQKEKETMIVEKLREIGFKNLIVKTIQAQVYGESTIVFKQYISAPQRQEISSLFKGLGYTMAILESKEITNDILIKIF